MSVCPSCGHRNEPGAKFCSECGVALAGARTPSYEERKVVTVLFADLVRSASPAERMDPEDIRALLSPLYARLRAELERFGGTVEKFIGDAVMALFGAPVAHEDDPERAVLAALAIRDWVRAEERIQVRLAVNTGEALVMLDARPAEGEGMAAGDVVNTAARLQAAAPVNGILVGERTFRATRAMIDYRPAAPVAAKGKKEPVAAWEALRARGRAGIGFPGQPRTALVGRAISGDPHGRADLQRGLEIALAGNHLAAAIRGYVNLSQVAERVDGDLPEALRLALEAQKAAQRLGARATLRWTRGRLVGLWFELGNWDKCVPAADEFLAESAVLGPHYYDTWTRCCRAWMRLARGDTAAALADQRLALTSARQAKDSQALHPALAVSAYVLAAAGRAAEAQPILSELLATGTADLRSVYDSSTDGVLAAEILGRRAEMQRWLGTQLDSPWFVVTRALADREFAVAAEALDSMGAARSAALARLLAAEQLASSGRRQEADDQLRPALDFFRSVGATRFSRQAEALLAASA